MLFNSYNYIFLFLPIVYILFILLHINKRTELSKLSLLFSSFVFYGFWSMKYLSLLLCSIFINYLIGNIILSDDASAYKKKVALILGISFNLGLLSFFKYSNFFIENIDRLFHINLPLMNIALPIAISFITFQQISYLCDCHNKSISNHSILDHALFTSFFPKLISGPIVRYNEMMPQFYNKEDSSTILDNIFRGAIFFSFGLFKKVIIADQFAVWADFGFQHHNSLSFVGALTASFSYTFQIYFDFSGYTDMAIGSALFFGISLPINFDSPYKAINIRDFWRRWHITLSRFLRDYLYIPLGGNRKGFRRSLINVLITFLLCGLWHGAGWTFVLWGLLHGIAMIFHAIWRKMSFKLSRLIAWFITFNFVNFAWIFFRAEDLGVAFDFLKALAGYNGIYSSEAVQTSQQLFMSSSFRPWYVFHEINGSIITMIWMATFFIVCIAFQNTNKLVQAIPQIKSNGKYAFLAGLLFSLAILFLEKSREFLYFNF